MQAAIERGDPVNYAPHILTHRLDDGAPTQLLIGMVLDDEIVPEAANVSLARALGIPQVASVLLPIDFAPEAGSPPVRANLAGGTAGLVQFDRIYDGDETVKATHNNIITSAVGQELSFAFLESYFETGVGQIVDPFERLGLERP